MAPERTIHQHVFWGQGFLWESSPSAPLTPSHTEAILRSHFANPKPHLCFLMQQRPLLLSQCCLWYSGGSCFAFGFCPRNWTLSSSRSDTFLRRWHFIVWGFHLSLWTKIELIFVSSARYGSTFIALHDYTFSTEVPLRLVSTSQLCLFLNHVTFSWFLCQSFHPTTLSWLP